jgi:hypothetical protein
MTEDSHYDLVSKLKPGRIILPVLIGLAIIWRIISYYPYLIIGALLVPGG